MNRLNMKRTVGSCLMAMAFFSCTHTDQTPTKDFVDYVNPYIGNISHLLVPTYPTVHLPNSMLRVYPERGDYTSDRVNGLPVVVTSHRGSSAFNLSPVQGEVSRPIVSYSYDLENITPYSYSVYLDEADIQVEYAPSHQAGIYHISFGTEGDKKKESVAIRLLTTLLPKSICISKPVSHLYAKGYWQMEKLIWKVRKAVPSLCFMEARRT